MTEKSGSRSGPPDEPIPGYKTIADFTKDGYKFLMEGTKYANQLPTGRDRNFYSAFDSFTKILNEESQRLMDGMTSVLKKNEVGANMRNQHIDKKNEILIDANDIILERVANNIDEMNGIKKTVGSEPVSQTVSIQPPVRINGSWNKNSNAHLSVSSSSTTVVVSRQTKEMTIRLLAAENIVKPQKFFTDEINNCHDDPWEPKIKDKPNSLKPLAIFLEETDVGREYSHPYEYELDRYTPSDELLTKIQLNKPKLIKDTPLIEINESSQLPDLLEELRRHKIIAVDLEHHSYRSFMGITCLMQISTQNTDYLIDTLALRNDLWILNEVFTKPDIVKVFHGAQSDIVWLQRDLSLYVVNMFDTYFAAKQLAYSGLSLAFLMNRFCNFIPNKQFQLADWRMRPLPVELKNYAREDTHYLIYIYQNMRNELIDRAHGETNLLKAVIDNSTNLCKKRYFKPTWHENIHLEFYNRCSRNFDNRQLFALKEIYKWRDQIARVEDESFSYVLPNNMLLEIAERLPKEMQGILACCSPVPPLVRVNLLEIHKIILKALEKPFEQPILKENNRARGSTTIITKINMDSPLHCPHDMTRNEEYRDDLPTLITATTQQIIQGILSTKLDIEQYESTCSVFNVKTNIKCVNSPERKDQKLTNNLKFLGPFERYQLVRPFIKVKEKFIHNS
ncbi:exosome complex component 10 homolog [Euwallacea fornicatus]|uniref:exosome complex component 10 homolog n=1 Tax=Euwallacea fornicatus TaxID=995702 RepID=UPI00338D7F3D